MAKSLYIYKIERISPVGWDEYDAAVVMAYDEDGARKMYSKIDADNENDVIVKRFGIVENIDVSNPVILQSFNNKSIQTPERNWT